MAKHQPSPNPAPSALQAVLAFLAQHEGVEDDFPIQLVGLDRDDRNYVDTNGTGVAGDELIPLGALRRFFDQKAEHLSDSFRADDRENLVELVRTRPQPDDPSYLHPMEDRSFMSPRAAIELGRSLIQSGERAYDHMLTSYVRGECSTCNNVRLVTVTKPNNVSMSEHCPDCSAPADPLRMLSRGRPAPPTPPFAREREATVLGGPHA